MSNATPAFLNGNGASYLRIASISIAAYDYLLTLPAEYRFYRGQTSWKLSPGCILFILIRYTSIITIVISNVGYFGSFSVGECHHYFMAAPVFKVIQTMISQIILGMRAYNISRRSRLVMWIFVVLFILITSMEWFTNLWDRQPVQTNHNCTPGNSISHLSVWLYYVLAMSYDLATLGISSWYLIGWQSSFRGMTGLIRTMFYDGLGFFIALTGANIFNLILYRTADESFQSSGASVAYAVTWIMSQRILIHLRDAAAEHQVKQVIAHPLQSARDVTHAMRYNLDGTKSRLTNEYNLTSPTKIAHDTTKTGSDPGHNDAELDVQVQIEQTVNVTVDYDQIDHERYRKKSRWDSA